MDCIILKSVNEIINEIYDYMKQKNQIVFKTIIKKIDRIK